MFCRHNEKKGEVLTWLTQNTILFNGNEYELKYQPSHRTNWCIFTI